MKRKTVSLLSLILSVVFALGAASCGLFDGDEKVIIASVERKEDTMVAIKVEKVEDNAMLIEVMEYLQEENTLAFEVSGGMVTSINGKANAADWSASWMLYTSDAEMANTAWGTYEYEGQTLGSAIVGAEALPVADGEIYIWSYQSF